MINDVRNKYSTAEEYPACRECIIKNHITCPIDHWIAEREQEKGIEADFTHCIFSSIARDFYDVLMAEDGRVNRRIKEVS